MPISAAELNALAARAGLDLAGVTPAAPLEDFARYESWLAQGHAAGLAYLADHRAALRHDPRTLLASAQTVLAAGVLYNTPHAAGGPISRYAWGAGDYHDAVRGKLEHLAELLQQITGPFEYRVCVDTAPLLERSLARQAGLGWIGKNTCLINQPLGSWFFLGEILLSLPIGTFAEPGTPPPDRCGSCRRCLDACPTGALPPTGGLDSNLCISYWTIEARHAPPEALRAATGHHVFGCDICQDVCPWNRRAPVSSDPAFQPVNASPDLAELAALTPEQFRQAYRRTPLWRTKHRGLLRNAAIAMGNAAEPRFRPLLETLQQHEDP